MRPRPDRVWALILALLSCASCAPGSSGDLDLPPIELDGGGRDASDLPPSADLVRGTQALDLVNPLIGTGGAGFAYAGMTPAVQVPLGFMRVGPDTTHSGAHPEAFHHFSGYYFNDPHLRGFSHTRFVGTGTADYGNLRVAFAPVAKLDRAPRKWWLEKSRGSEVAEPGYYRVETAEGVRAEMTASDHAAIHRYAVPTGIVMAIDPAASVDDRGIIGSTIRIDGGRISGSLEYRGDYVGRLRGFELHFEAQVDPPPAETLVWDGATFAPGREISGPEAALALRWSSDASVLLRVAISLVSPENAQRRFDEIEQQSFEETRASTRDRWADVLDRVQIAGGTDAQREIFYTALYNCFRMPSRLDEYGVYPGLDGEMHETDHPYYTDLSLWDTYRTLHPLWTLIAPDETRDVLRSLLLMGRDGGYIPRWPAALTYTNGMEGDSAALLFAEGATKGIDGVDYATAFAMLQDTADAPVPEGAPYGGRQGIEAFIAQGWISADRFSNAASNTLEYALDDNAMAELAAFLQHPDEARYRERSLYYKNIWDPETRFFRPRNEDGSFVDPFSVVKFNDRSGVFAEGSAWHYRFYASHDPAGMIELFGGADAFVTELDTFMEKSRLFNGDLATLVLPDPYYWHTNQPSLHVPFLYGPAGRWDLLQHWTARIMQFGYNTSPDGLVGNDDGGTLSSWYVLGAIGAFPVVGTNRWLTFEPTFDEVRIHGRAPAWYGLEPGERGHADLLAEND